MSRSAALLTGAMLLAPAARAQVAAPRTDLVAQFHPIVFDAAGPPAPTFPAGSLTAPLRLALQGGMIPIGGAFGGCASREEPSGNSVGGIPLALQRELHLTPALTLAGFSRLGCPLDATAGVVLSLAVPIRRSIALVFSLGVIAAPALLPLFGPTPRILAKSVTGGDSPATIAARADVVWKTKGGRVFHVGVGSIGHGNNGVSFGSGF